MRQEKRLVSSPHASRIALAALGVVAAVGCKQPQVLQSDTLSTPAAPRVIAGTDEAVDAIPAGGLDAQHDFVPAEEEQEFRVFVGLVKLIQRTLEPEHTPPSGGKVLRGFHAKAHGCLVGHFYTLAQPLYALTGAEPKGAPRLPLGAPGTTYDPRYARDTHAGLFADGYVGDDDKLVDGVTHDYPVLVRFSNAQSRRQSDSKIDGKGMALKVMGKSRMGVPFVQDFTMSDTPTCNAKTAARFMAFGLSLAGIEKELKRPTAAAPEPAASAKPGSDATWMQWWLGQIDAFRGKTTQVYEDAKTFLLDKQQVVTVPPSLKFMLEEGNDATHDAIVQMIKESFNKTNPVDIQYWSRTPYRLGGHAVKFTVRPVVCCAEASGFEELAGCPARPQPGKAPVSWAASVQAWSMRQYQALHGSFASATQVARSQIRKYTDSASFRSALVESAQQPICYDFNYQFQTDVVATPVENPTKAWPVALSPEVTFAKLVLPPQVFTGDDQLAMCEDLGFTPEHFLPEHEPMGHMNRARLAVYRGSRENRRSKRPEIDATAFPAKLIQ